MGLTILAQQQGFSQQHDVGSMPFYDSGVSMSQQDEKWTCSCYAADWCLRSLGVDSDDERIEAYMVSHGLVSEAHGRLDGRGFGLADTLRVSLPPGTLVEVIERASWDWLQHYAGRGPIALGGHGWGEGGHCCAVRYSRNPTTVALANSAPGYDQIWQELTLADFHRVGPWSAVRVAA